MKPSCRRALATVVLGLVLGVCVSADEEQGVPTATPDPVDCELIPPPRSITPSKSLLRWQANEARNQALEELERIVGNDPAERLQRGVVAVTPDSIDRAVVVIVDKAHLEQPTRRALETTREAHRDIRIELRQSCVPTPALLDVHRLLSNHARLVELVGTSYSYGLDVVHSHFHLRAPCRKNWKQWLEGRFGDALFITCGEIRVNPFARESHQAR